MEEDGGGVAPHRQTKKIEVHAAQVGGEQLAGGEPPDQMVNGREWVVLIPAMTIAVSTWFYRILVLNRYESEHFTRMQVIAFVVYSMSGIAGWFAALSMQLDSFTLQLFASICRSSASYIGFIMIYNDNISLSRQQMNAFVFSLLITVMWELQHRLTISTLGCGA